MSDQALLVTWIVGVVITAFAVASYLWREGTYERDPFLIDYIAPFLAGIMWPAVAAVAAVAGLGWLFIQAAKPGRIRLPRRTKKANLDDWERAAMQARITELETELGIKSPEGPSQK